MPRLLAALALVGVLAGAAAAQAATPAVAPPRGLVTDRANVIDAATQQRLTRLLEELQQKTGAEIAVLTVDTTQPLDDFTYAMQVADAWKIGKKGEDTGVLVLVAVRDRKVRIVTGYGLEGILPDGLIGEIQDRYMVPAFRTGDMAGGIWQGVSEIARRVAAARGVTLTGVPAAAPQPVRGTQPQLPFWLIVLTVVVLMLLMSRGGMGGRGRRGPIIFPGGFRGGGGDNGFGGFGGGGGGFGGFGGGGFGGGGAGRSW